jgi:hypothetical protein
MSGISAGTTAAKPGRQSARRTRITVGSKPLSATAKDGPLRPLSDTDPDRCTGPLTGPLT